MDDKLPIDDIRRQIQESLAQSKREQLQDEFAMQFEHIDSSLPPEVQNEWLDSVLEFERKFEIAKRIIDDVQIEGWASVFTPSTPAYDVEFWTETFISDFFLQEQSYFLSGLEKQPLFDSHGNPISAAEFQQKIKNIWQFLSAGKRCAIEMFSVQVGDEEGAVIAAITFNHNAEIVRVESSFRLQPSPYTGWDIVQTTFLDDIFDVLHNVA